MVVMMGVVSNDVHHYQPRHLEHPRVIVSALAVEESHAAVLRYQQPQCLEHLHGKLEVLTRPVVRPSEVPHDAVGDPARRRATRRTWPCTRGTVRHGAAPSAGTVSRALVQSARRSEEAVGNQCATEVGATHRARLFSWIERMSVNLPLKACCGCGQCRLPTCIIVLLACSVIAMFSVVS